MHILVINCGSSSLKAAIVRHEDTRTVVSAKVERIGEPEPRLQIDSDGAESAIAPDHATALAAVLPRMMDRLGSGESIAAVGHRVVHGGEKFVYPTLIDDDVEATIEALIDLAPLHNPANLAGIRAARRLVAEVPHIAIFDTAFHATLPRRSRTYALPAELTDAGVRRYGFHGISHHFVAQRAASFMDADLRDLRIITCHLGNGCSVCAVEYGRSVETSMGMTPLEGLVMGTRVGDVDAGVLIDLMRKQDWDVDQLDDVLNRQSGLAGLSGVGNDMRDIEERASAGDEHCRLAIQVFAHRLRKYIGAYAAVMGGVDAIVFTAGIGENSEVIRHRVSQRLEFLGAVLDEDKNRDIQVTDADPVAEFSTRNSRTRLLAVRTDEQAAIAGEAGHIVLEHQRTSEELTIPVAISARHVHLTQETVELLFGAGHQLTERNPLSQPGQFACNEVVTVVGPKRRIENVRVLGPTRPKNQVEISRTDEFFLGLDAPVRASGDVDNTPGCLLIGSQGEVQIEQGVICAWRHIHMTNADAEKFGVQDRDVVEVAIQSSGRDLVFGDVLVRVKDSYRLEMHIDTDEGNAAELSGGATAALVATDGRASMRRRTVKYDALGGAGE